MWSLRWKCYCSNSCGVCVPVGRALHSHMSSLSLNCLFVGCVWGPFQDMWWCKPVLWLCGSFRGRDKDPLLSCNKQYFWELNAGFKQGCFCGAVLWQTDHDSGSICSIQRLVVHSDVHFIQNKATISLSDQSVFISVESDLLQNVSLLTLLAQWF